MRTPEGDEEIGTVSSISGETLLATVDEHYEGHLVARLEALSLGGSVSPVAVANQGTTLEPGDGAADQEEGDASSVDAIYGGDPTYWALHRQGKELAASHKKEIAELKAFYTKTIEKVEEEKAELKEALAQARRSTAS